MDDVVGVDRGTSASQMRTFRCKDCQRELDALRRKRRSLKKRRVSGNRLAEVTDKIADLEARAAVYNEQWAAGLIDRGGSRTDRCKQHRETHRNRIQGIAVAYIDLRTVGEVRDRQNPTGPLGGLGPLPGKHNVVPNTSYPLQDVNVGMTDAHIVEMVRLLREKRVLILKAGTGTGKSTFAPYRLLDPPPESLTDVPAGSPFARLSELGQIVVTEPRVQATIGVAEFVGGVMSGAGGVGPGFPVGYQVSGDRNHDEACQLVYVTDGTMINWLREGRLSRIGTVIVDEAHERSTNIDFILGYLKRELNRYPHLRVIVTSATFNTAFYQEYFGGPEVANVMDVPATKSFGYGMPLFPNLDAPEAGEDDVIGRWNDESLPLSPTFRDEQSFVQQHWPDQHAPALTADDVIHDADIGHREDVWKTTKALLDLRYQGSVPIEEWRERMPDELAKFVVQLARGLDEADIYGDILAFLPTTRTIELACDQIELALGPRYRRQVFPLISTLPKARQIEALASRRKGDPRKIVVSTNLAETSLTVEGVRFVVDSGLIAQSEWDPMLAKGTIPTKMHSRAGIKQRWGRVGRKAPGWVFPLYSKGQFLSLAEDTPPGSTRENLESLVMTAKLGGIDDVVGFPWPAAYTPTSVALDESATAAQATFGNELARADAALTIAGAVDADGHPTSFGKELARFQGLGSAASALAILYADTLACVPEVVTILGLLEDSRLIGKQELLLDNFEWPDEWRLEAAERHRGLASLCEDDAHLVLLIVAAWERSDPDTPPWEPSDIRREWARLWWVNHDALLGIAGVRRDVLAALSPAMKEEVRRFIEPALLDRARGVITRCFAPHAYHRSPDGSFVGTVSGHVVPPNPDSVDSALPQDAGPDGSTTDVIVTLEDNNVVPCSVDSVVALRRRDAKDDNRISNLVAIQPWALPPKQLDHVVASAGEADAMRLVVEAARYAAPDATRDAALHLIDSWPVGQRMRLDLNVGPDVRLDHVLATIPPFATPEDRSGASADKKARRGTKRSRARDRQDDEQDGTRDDSDYDLNPHRQRIGARDEADLELAAFGRADAEVERAASCGCCDACTSGRESRCTRSSPAPFDDAENAIGAWLERARAGVDVSNPSVSIEGQIVNGEGWYEVVGYGRSADQAQVILRRDWRPDGFTGTPAEHVGVQAGDPIEVSVGPMTRHHGGELRVFDRVDGQGRFVVKEASTSDGRRQEQRGELAVSLHRGARGLLSELVEGAQLTATVVPARVRGCYTITLLELLHQHPNKAAGGRGVEFKTTRTKDGERRSPMFSAIVEAAPNHNDYARVTLLLHDSSRGIQHHFDLRVATSPDADGPAAATFEAGTPLFLSLIPDRAQLAVGGLDLDVLRTIERESDRQLRLGGVPDQPHLRSDRNRRHATEQGDEHGGDEGEAGPDAVLHSMSEEPLSRAAALRLCALDDSPEWQNDVWTFWARSHHRRPNPDSPCIPGTTTEVVDIPAKVQIVVTAPIEAKRDRYREFANKHRVETPVDGTVTRATDRGVEVRLDDGVLGWIPIKDVSWTYTEHTLEKVKTNAPIRALIIAVDLDEPKIVLSAKALTPKPYDAYKASHRIGDRVRGVVTNSTSSHVYLRLEEGVSGAVWAGNLAHRRVESAQAAVADVRELDAVIKGFKDEREQVELSVKDLLPNPFTQLKAMQRVGSDVSGTVTNTTETHVYVDLVGGAQGVVYIGDLTHRKDVTAKWVPDGTRLDARIKRFDDKREQVELSCNALAFERYKAAYPLHQYVNGRVLSTNASFVLVDLGYGAAGSIHISKLVRGRRLNDPLEAVQIGMPVTARIIGWDETRFQAKLSLVD